MPVTNSSARDQYTATSGQTIFAYTFEIFQKEDIAVEQNGTLLTVDVDFTVSGVGNDSGGNVTLTTGATAGDIITIYRDMDLARTTNYQPSGSFLADEVDDDFDRLWMALQQQQAKFGQAIRAKLNDTALNSTNTELADVNTRANKVLGFDNSGLLNYVNVNLAAGTYKYHATVASMQADDSLQVGDVVIIGERANSLWDVIAATTNNGYDILDGTASGVSLQLRHENGVIDMAAFGVSKDATPSFNQAAAQRALDVAGSTTTPGTSSAGGEVKCVMGVTIAGSIEVKGIGTTLYAPRGRGRVNSYHFKLDASSTDTKTIHVSGPASTLRGLTILGKGPTASGTYAITAEEGYDGTNNADVDLYIENCEIGNAETCIKVSGRGLYVNDTDFTLMTNVFELDYPGAAFVEGPNADQKTITGYRCYTVRDSRFHAASGGFIVKNTGAQKANLQQFLMTGCFCDATIRIWDGEMHKALIDGNHFIYKNATATSLFNLSGGSDSMVSNNYIGGMPDNGYGTTREYIGIASFTNCSNIKFVDNEFFRVNKDCFTIVTGNSDIYIEGNTFREFCLINNTETRYPVRVAGAIDGLRVQNNEFINSSTRTNDTYIIGNVGGVAITNCYREGNKFDTSNWILDNIIESDKQGSHSSYRRYERVTGDGTASQVVTFAFEPLWCIVNCISGVNKGETLIVSAFSGTGSGEVDIVNNTVELKGIFNATGDIYSVVAFI